MLMSLEADSRSDRGKTMQFKHYAMQRADRDGIAKAALDFGISESMLYAWREHRRIEDELAYLENL